MQITFKLLEIASNIYSKSNQLKDLYLLSLTEGFNLKINIYESISNNLSYSINYKGISQKIKLCLIKGQICIGIGQIIISNKKQTIEIFPEFGKNLSMKTTPNKYNFDNFNCFILYFINIKGPNISFKPCL